ncbi:MAG: phosphate ABC transporter ATP-binding protein [Candidatus Bathyarchaeota archaeon]|nr:phosphate ABC transporter ATP-binding protein [Candidatus Bathyarchaeota archaeon]
MENPTVLEKQSNRITGRQQENMNISLRLEGIEKSYKDIKALDDVDFEAEGGKIVVLIGVNGAGKSTLLRIIAGLENQDRGLISFNNQNVTSGELRQIATLVFQKTAMFSRSVYDNLAYGLKIRGKKDEEIKNAITEALHGVGLKNFEKRKAKKTSGGEQQRIALARAFLLDPKILLLDEPTANLDPNNAIIIEKAVLKYREKNHVIIIATHNLSQARRLGDEVVHIHGGKMIDCATPDEFFGNPQNEVTRKFINGELEF